MIQQCTDLLQVFQFAATDQSLQVTSECELLDLVRTAVATTASA